MRRRCSTSRGVSSRGNRRNCFAEFLSEGGREGKRITMTSTLTPWRDKLGHALVLLLLAATSAFGSGSYPAKRFEVYATIEGGGVRMHGAAALGPRWAIAGAAVFFIGLLIAALARRGYPVPSIHPDETTTIEPPSALPAAG